MEFLKLKVLDVLSEIISVKEFEQWLYTEDKVLDLVSSDRLVFEIININYKKEKTAIKELLNLVSGKFSPEEILLLNAITHCRKIIQLQSEGLIFDEVVKLYKYFDYDNHYNLFWQFYILKDRIDLVELGYYKKEEVIEMIKKLAETIVLKFMNYSSLSDKLGLIDYEDEKNSSTFSS